jgi:hypothetical protein
MLREVPSAPTKRIEVVSQLGKGQEHADCVDDRVGRDEQSAGILVLAESGELAHLETPGVHRIAC